MSLPVYFLFAPLSDNKLSRSFQKRAAPNRVDNEAESVRSGSHSSQALASRGPLGTISKTFHPCEVSRARHQLRQGNKMSASCREQGEAQQKANHDTGVGRGVQIDKPRETERPGCMFFWQPRPPSCCNSLSRSWRFLCASLLAKPEAPGWKFFTSSPAFQGQRAWSAAAAGIVATGRRRP